MGTENGTQYLPGGGGGGGDISWGKAGVYSYINFVYSIALCIPSVFYL